MYGLGFPSLVPLIFLFLQEDFLRGRIKVGGKVGVNVGKPGENKEVTLSRAKNEIEVSTEIPFSKRWVQSVRHVYTLESSVFLLLLSSPT